MARPPELNQPTHSERVSAYREGHEDHESGYTNQNPYRNSHKLLAAAYDRGYDDARVGVYNEAHNYSYLGK